MLSYGFPSKHPVYTLLVLACQWQNMETPLFQTLRLRAFRNQGESRKNPKHLDLVLDLVES